MFNLIKMDFYRLFRSKVIKVGLIAAAIIAFVGMLLNFGVLELIKITMKDDPASAESIGFLFPIVTWIVHVDFADVVLTGTNAFSLFVSCMMVASFIGAEQSCGYVKNVAGQLSNRGMTIVSKYVVTCAIQLFVLIVYIIVSSICAGLFFTSYIKAYSIGKLIAGLALRYLLFCAMNAVLVFVCTLTKSHAVAMVVGAIFGIGVMGLVYKLASALLGMVKIVVDIEKFMPDGINGLISVASVGDVALKAVIVSVIFIAVFLFGAVLLFKKRDVK